MDNEQNGWKTTSDALFLALIVALLVLGAVCIIIGQPILASVGGALVGAAASLGATFVLEKLELTTHVKAYEARLNDALNLIRKMQTPTLLSLPNQLDNLNLRPGVSMFHYSRIELNGNPVWQEAELLFFRTTETTCGCEANWLSPIGSAVPYRVELGVRGKRLFLTFTVCAGIEEPAIEVYPAIFRPGEDAIAGIGVDDTWHSRRGLVEPTILARKRLVDRPVVGGFLEGDVHPMLESIWLEKFNYANFFPIHARNGSSDA